MHPSFFNCVQFLLEFFNIILILNFNLFHDFFCCIKFPICRLRFISHFIKLVLLFLWLLLENLSLFLSRHKLNFYRLTIEKSVFQCRFGSNKVCLCVRVFFCFWIIAFNPFISLFTNIFIYFCLIMNLISHLFFHELKLFFWLLSSNFLIINCSLKFDFYTVHLF